MIESYSFGSMTVAGLRCDKDLKIIRGEVVSGWWRKEGHLLQETDLEDLLSAAPQVLVVGTGAYGAMRVDGGLRALLEERRIELIAAPPAGGGAASTGLAAGAGDGAGAFHLTC